MQKMNSPQYNISINLNGNAFRFHLQETFSVQ